MDGSDTTRKLKKENSERKITDGNENNENEKHNKKYTIK